MKPQKSAQRPISGAVVSTGNQAASCSLPSVQAVAICTCHWSLGWGFLCVPFPIGAVL